MTTPKIKIRPKRKPRAPAKPKAEEPENELDTLAEKMAEYQTLLADNITKYEEMVADATSQLDAMVKAATPAAPKEKVQVKPECQWLEKDSGKYLVMNEAAAEFFGAIFEQVGVLANELSKQNTK